MGEWQPLFIGVGILLLIGVFMPLIVVNFVDLEDIEDTGIFSPLIDVIQNGINIQLFDLTVLGFNIGTINFDFFQYLGDTIVSALVDYLTIFSIIPLIIVIPLFIVSMMGISYTIVRLVRG